jgi:predicted PurR-regulated permease PerM
MNGEPLLPSKTIQNIVFGAILILLFIAVCRLFAPFFSVLLWSILFYVLFVPLHQRITGKMNFSGLRGFVLKNIMAGVFSLGTLVLIAGPISFVASRLFRQITDLIHLARNYFGANPEFFSDVLEHVSRLIYDFSSGVVVVSAGDIQDRIMSFLGLSLQSVIRISGGIARNVGSFAAGLVFMLFCLFFFYLDGPYLSRLVLHIIPIKKDYISALVGKFKDITRNLFLGYIMVALVQALMAYIIFTIFAVRGSLVFAVLVLFCSFLPMFGAGLVWLPMGIVRVISGNVVGGIVFLAVSGFFISTLDNFLRPIFLQNRIRLHPLFIFVSILGGVVTFGFNGLILGPMVIIFFLTVLDLFLTEHKINIDEELP